MQTLQSESGFMKRGSSLVSFHTANLQKVQYENCHVASRVYLTFGYNGPCKLLVSVTQFEGNLGISRSKRLVDLLRFHLQQPRCPLLIQSTFELQWIHGLCLLLGSKAEPKYHRQYCSYTFNAISATLQLGYIEIQRNFVHFSFTSVQFKSV